MIKLIPGFDDYCVSDEGRVYRIIESPPGRALKELKTYNCNGHNCIKLRGKKIYVSILVSELFLGPRPDRHLIFHKNKDRLDDRVENLIYLPPDKIQLYSTYTEEYLREVVFK